MLTCSLLWVFLVRVLVSECEACNWAKGLGIARIGSRRQLDNSLHTSKIGGGKFTHYFNT